MRLVLVFALACSGLGCTVSSGGNAGIDGGSKTDSGGGASCAFTLSGAYSATGTCTAVAGYDPTSATNPGVGFNIASGNTTLFTFASELSTSNNFSAGSYDQSTVQKAAGSTLNGSAAWLVSAHNSGDPDQGSFMLVISDPGPVVTGTNGGMVWTSPHGTLTATMPALAGSGTTGTVAVQVNF